MSVVIACLLAIPLIYAAFIKCTTRHCWRPVWDMVYRCPTCLERLR